MKKNLMNIIQIIYCCDNNKGKIELIINGKKNELISRYGLKEGENKIEIIIKNKITNLEFMFYKYNSLKNLEELKFLDAKEINNFSYIFNGCESLSNVNGLEKMECFKWK
jgi:hypothetical protein